MATLALAVAGAAVGGALLPAGVTMLGATLTGAAIGSQVGALAGSFVDQCAARRLRAARTRAGPAPLRSRVTASTEGAPIPRLYGRARLGGQVIWATNLEEEVVQQRPAAAAARAALGRQRRHRHRVPLLRQFRRRPCRRRDHRPRPRLGRRQGARPLHRHLSPLHRQRGPAPRQPDRGQGRRRQRARLSRHRLHRLRAHGARRLRQPHPAALLRGAPRRRRLRDAGARRRA